LAPSLRREIRISMVKLDPRSNAYHRSADTQKKTLQDFLLQAVGLGRVGRGWGGGGGGWGIRRVRRRGKWQQPQVDPGGTDHSRAEKVIISEKTKRSVYKG